MVNNIGLKAITTGVSLPLIHSVPEQSGEVNTEIKNKNLEKSDNQKRS
jgi:hypothetical protein